MKQGILICFLIVVLAASVYVSGRQAMLILMGEKTDAVVTAIYYDGGGVRSLGSHCSVHYRYTDKDSVNHTSFYNFACTPISPPLAVGDIIPIIVDPSDPTQSTADNFLYNMLYVVGGILVLCILLILVFQAIKKKVRAD